MLPPRRLVPAAVLPSRFHPVTSFAAHQRRGVSDDRLVVDGRTWAVGPRQGDRPKSLRRWRLRRRRRTAPAQARAPSWPCDRVPRARHDLAHLPAARQRVNATPRRRARPAASSEDRPVSFASNHAPGPPSGAPHALTRGLHRGARSRAASSQRGWWKDCRPRQPVGRVRNQQAGAAVGSPRTARTAKAV